VELNEPNIAGLSPESGNYMIIHFAEYDTYNQLYQTNIDSLASDWTNYQDNKDLFDHYIFEPYKMKYGFSLLGFNRAIMEMHEGDHALFVVPSGLAYSDANFTTYVYNVSLKRVIPNINQYDSLQLIHFRGEYAMDSSNYIPTSGIFYKETVTPDPGETWRIIETNDSIYLNFWAYFMQENTLIPFDSTGSAHEILVPKSKLVDFKTADYLSFTKGFAGAIDTMRIGTTADVLVPYQKGYGAAGYRHEYYGYIIVPEYTSLVYRIRVNSRK